MIYQIPLGESLEVLRAGHIRYRKGWSESYCHARNLLIYVNSGIFRYRFADGHTVVLHRDDHLIIPAQSAYVAEVGEDCDYYYLHFSSAQKIIPMTNDEAAAYFEKTKREQEEARSGEYQTPSAKSLPVLETSSHGERESSIRYRISRCEEFRHGNDPLDRLRLDNAFVKVLLSLSATTGAKLLHTQSLSPLLSKVTRYIEDHYPDDISLTSLSEEFRVSKQYLMRVFREGLGTTVTHYINDLRLRKSMELLTFSSLSVSEVAYAVGYSGAYYFDRLFKATYSITPGEFQKLHKVSRLSAEI